MADIDPNTVAAHEHGLVRIYGVDLPMDEQAALYEKRYDDVTGDADWPIQDALGAQYLDEDSVEYFPVSDLEQLGLGGYLVTGNDIPSEDIEPYLELFNRINDYVLIVFSSAFGGVEQTLTPKAPLRHLATLRQRSASATFKPLPDAGAQGIISDPPQKKKPSDAAMSGRVATVALLVMFVLIWLMIKVAG